MTDFKSFVILAEMRTGSNLLETFLNAHPQLQCYAELFNPSFIDHPRTTAVCGFDRDARDADPVALLKATRAAHPDKLTGFRLFHDHDPRIWKAVLEDRSCAKIVLTRNPLEMYVSRKIASATDQWRLHNIARWRSAKVRFEAQEFETMLAALQKTQLAILHHLQDSGQTAFYINYEDLTELAPINGLLKWLGQREGLRELPRDLKKQNPGPLEDKLSNPEDLAKGLAQIDRFDLGRTPNFEPRRGPMLPALLAAPKSAALFIPIRGGLEGEMAPWLAALDGAAPEEVQREFTHARLRDWRRAHPHRRSFTVLRHPLLRARYVFERRVLSGELEPVREHMKRLFDTKLPKPGKALSPEQDRAAFLAFLKFCKASLAGQTGLQPWPAWASQAAILEGFAPHCPPDLVLREENLAAGLSFLAAELGLKAPLPPAPSAALATTAFDEEIAAACKDAYWRDYEQFGFPDLPA